MHRLLFALLFLSLNFTLSAQSNPTAPALVELGPVMSIDESVFLFENIEEGEIVSHDFVISNVGSKPLVLSGTTSSCDCATAKWPREPIAPGKSATVTYEFNSKGKSGEQTHRLTLISNTEPADHYLYLIGRVLSEGAVAPSNFDLPSPPAGPMTDILFDEETFDFGTILEGEIIAHTFTFTNTGEEPLLISSAKGSCGCTVPAWPKDPIAPGETASITVEFNSKGKRGRRNQKVTITANTTLPQTFIYLTGDIEPLNNQIEVPPLLAPNEEKVTGTAIEAPPAPEVPEIITPDPNCVTLFPNPTTDLLQLKMGEQVGQSATFALYSYTGQLMARRELEAVDAVVSFDVSHYPAGSYVVQIQVGERPPETQCFVVKK